MKKQIIIIGISVLLLTIAISGCTSDEKVNTQTPLLFVVTGTDIDEDYVYVDIQNIDTEEGEFAVEFTLKYLDPSSTGADDYGGGQTPSSDDNIEGIDYGFNAVFATISPHETERVRCPKRVPSGWEFAGWDYEIIPPYINQIIQS